MQKKNLLYLFLAIGQILMAQNSQTLESQSFRSKTLKRDAKFSVYLPAGYEQNQRHYPVVYLLHGYTGCETDWVQLGDMPQLLDKAIAEGKIPPMIVIMPDGQNSWYINAPTGNSNYEDFIIKELIPRTDSIYRTRTQKDARAIVGLSMGGNGAFCLAMKYPKLFSATVVLSGAFWSQDMLQDKEEKEGLNTFFEPIYGKNFMETSDWQQNSPFLFLKKENIEAYNSVKIMFDCGDDDFVTEGQLNLSNHLRKLKIKHELRIREGIHNWTFWREALIPALQFCGEEFHHK